MVRTIATTLGLLLLGTAARVDAVTGKVVTPSATGVAGLTVVLKSTGQTATTDAQGGFSLGSVGVDGAMVRSGCRFAGGVLQIHAAEATTLRVEVLDVRGVEVLPPLEQRVEQGFTEIAPLAGIAERGGLYFVRVRMGGEEQIYRAFRAGASGTTGPAAAARTAAATDTITLRDGSTVIGKIGFTSGAATISDIVVVRRSIKGTIVLNGLAIASSTLALTPSTGTALTPAITVSSGSWTASTAWAMYKQGTTWTGTVKFLDGSGAVLGTGTTTFADNAETVTFSSISLAAATVPDPPASLKTSIDWVWENRIKDPTEANALGFYNYLFDQIYAEKGSLYVCVRWESKTKVTKAQRDKFEGVASRSINNWVKWLKGYDAWAYDSVNVKIVGWAVADAAYLDATGLTVPVYVNGGLESEGKTAPICPDACNRDRFHNTGKVTTTYPNCKSPDQRFDITLWGTDGFNGGAGGDWGSRTASSYILSVLDTKEPHIIEHEIGHAFSLPDFYDDNQFPPSGLPTAIMQAGASAVITDWDGWMLRRVWTELKKAEPTRFK